MAKDHGNMGMRGVTRPMPLHQHHGGDGDDGMSDEHRREMLVTHHKQTLWCYWLVILLGFWTLTVPFTFGYGDQIATLERDVWLTADARIWSMTVSDLVSGLLLVVFGLRSLKPDRPVSLWVCCLTGLWLSAAPLLFWASTPAGYLNATLVGALVIALTILIPGMPTMIMFMKMGGNLPKGWSYNPSSWAQRGIMIALAFAGWLISRYLGAVQFGFIDHGWDPFFAASTDRVLGSKMSDTWPVSDAGLGAFSYTIEFLMGWMGAPTRWRTMPWMVTFFGILVIPLGLTHILLVISQPVVVGAWCTFCLLAAAIMLPMIPLQVDEVIAMAQHVKRRVDAGEPFWRVFWRGGDAEAAERSDRTPEIAEFGDHPSTVTKASLWGISASPWLVATSAIGVWLMFVPSLFGFAQTMPAHIHTVGGALIVTTSVIAMGEPVRRGRYFNLLLGLAVALGPWLFGDVDLLPRILAVVAGVAVMGLSVPRGPIRESFGSWDRFVS